MTNVTYKFLSMYLFLFLTLYMFQAHRAHHQERQIVSIQPLVIVSVFWTCAGWKFDTVGLLITFVHTTRPPTATRGCTDTICLS